MEEWRDIKGYEGRYQVSSLGRVRSLDREVTYSNGHVHKYAGQILHLNNNSKGYLHVSLGKGNTSLVHRLVADAFLPNPYNLPEVNHINEDTTDNTVSNLEWCDKSYNINYGTRNERCYRQFKRPINQLDANGNFIKRWESVTEASLALSGHRGGTNISKVLTGSRNTAFGCKWEYAKEVVASESDSSQHIKEGI